MDIFHAQKTTQLNLEFNLQEQALYLIFLGFFHLKYFFKCLYLYIYFLPKNNTLLYVAFNL